MIPTDPIPCANPPLSPKGKPLPRTHRPTVLLGLCETDRHDRCSGYYTHPCGCRVPCRCTAEHDPDRRHAYEETSVLPSPFAVPESTPDESEESPTDVIAPGGRLDWHTHRQRPWITGTGAPPAPLEVLVRAFAMAAGDLICAAEDGPEDYDETALMAMLGILRAAVRRAGLLDAMLVKHLYENHPRGKHLLPDLGEVRTYRREAKVRWDERGTADAVIEAKMEERGGVLPDDPREVVSWLLEVAAIDYYRKTALRALGLDPQDFYTSEKGTLAVDVPIPD